MSVEAVTNITTLRLQETVAEAPFYIPMTGPAARPRRSLKHDDTFIVLDSHGDIGADGTGEKACGSEARHAGEAIAVASAVSVPLNERGRPVKR